MKTVKQTVGKLILGCVLALSLHSTIRAQIPWPPGGGDGGTNGGGTQIVNTNRNYVKFMNQTFALLDTNSVAANDTNLYNALLAFPADTNTAPTLQVAPYGTNTLLIRANHFDYSNETERDFALLVCDKVETPVWKIIDFAGAYNTNDGWLVQGSVPNWQVTDPMYFQLSDIAHNVESAFLRAIPYGGPTIALSGYQPYDVVSNTITLHAQVLDLSGVTNVQFTMDVDGFPARYSLSGSNTIALETKYNPNGLEGVYFQAGSRARVYNLTNAPFNAKFVFTGRASIPLDFENDTYLAFASDNASPEIGTNYILFVIDKEQDIEARIFDPANNQTLASYAGHVPYPATVVIPWNFTLSNGVTAYTNDTYGVTFIAYDPTELNFTNRIERYGVRTAGGNIVTYEEEDPALSAGSYLNSEANTWIANTLAPWYETLYYTDFASYTQYSPAGIGTNRDNPPFMFPFVLTGNYQIPWAVDVYNALTNKNFSDFGYYMGHGNGTGLGGGPPGSTFVRGYIDTTTVWPWVQSAHVSPNWRMRKVAIWSCYSDATANLTAQGTIKSWPEAFGIKATRSQTTSMSAKNVGLFFIGDLPQGGYSGTFGGTSAEVAANFDMLWVAGPSPFPGACDPTYAFSWVLNQIKQISPEINKALPTWIGFGYLPYTAIYDSELVTNNITNISY